MVIIEVAVFIAVGFLFYLRKHKDDPVPCAHCCCAHCCCDDS